VPRRPRATAQVLGEAEEERDDHLGRAGELGAQVLALGRDSGGTGVEVALAAMSQPTATSAPVEAYLGA
jgi:hypothetical protein